MTDFLWPPDLTPSLQTWRKVDPAATFSSPLSGALRTVERTGVRFGCTITIAPNKGVSRARAMAIVAAMRRSDRIWIPDFSTTPAGSFPTTELIANNDFSDGLTNVTNQNCTSSVTDRVLRQFPSSSVASNPGVYRASSSLSQYAAYVGRGFGYSRSGAARGIYLADNGSARTASVVATSDGMLSVALVTSAAGAGTLYPSYFTSSADFSLASFMDIYWSSLSQGALVDNGPNALLQSQTFDNASWTKTRATISADAGTAPDGTTTADRLVEDSSASTTHFVGQSVTVGSAASDFTFSVSAKAGTRGFGAIQLTEGTGSTVSYAFFDLSDGSWDSEATGANWSNLRKHVVSLGDGWYRFTMTVRKTNAATSITARIYIANAADGSSYSGDGASYISIWGASLAQSSLPVRYRATTTTASTGSSQTGASLYLKGLPTSTEGLGRIGDPVQVGNQINFLAARLDSDAAGNGVMHTALPWITAPSDNDPVIFNTPMALMKVVEDTSWDTGPGQFSPFELELIQA